MQSDPFTVLDLSAELGTPRCSPGQAGGGGWGEGGRISEKKWTDGKFSLDLSVLDISDNVILRERYMPDSP